MDGYLFETDNKKISKRQTWLANYANIWQETLGGTFPFGEAAVVFRQLEQTNSVHEITRNLRVYLTKTEAKYVSLTRFGQTFRAWAPGSTHKTGPDDETIAAKLRAMGKGVRLNWGPWRVQCRFEEVGFDGLNQEEQSRLVQAWKTCSR